MGFITSEPMPFSQRIGPRLRLLVRHAGQELGHGLDIRLVALIEPFAMAFAWNDNDRFQRACRQTIKRACN